MIKKNVKLVISLMVIGLVMFSAKAQSQNYHCYDNWSTNADMNWWNARIPSDYALSESQVNKLNDIRIENNKKIVPLQNELMILKRNLQYYNTDSDSDVQKLKSDRKKVRELEDKISDLNLDAQLGIKKLLTKEQLVYFNDGGYGWWNMTENCWYSGQNMMDYRNRMMSGKRCCR